MTPSILEIPGFARINDRGYYILSTGKISHFTTRELKCKCGCGSFQMAQSAIDMIENVRTRLISPIFPHSGVRCWRYHNWVYELENRRRARKGLKPIAVPKDSMHLPRTPEGVILLESGTAYGCSHAVDFTAAHESPSEVQRICDQEAESLGVWGLGSYPGFTHCDSRGHVARWNG